MKTLTATETARNFSRVLDLLEHGQEEITIIRNHHPVATLVPGASRATALEALSDLHDKLDTEEGRKWLEDVNGFDHPLKKELFDPWA